MSNKIFVGWLPHGGPAHASHFVLGKICSSLESLQSTFVIELLEPVWFQLCPTQDPKTKQIVYVHQPMVDTYFAIGRDEKMDFNLNVFAGWRFLNPEVRRDEIEIENYNKMLQGIFTQLAGLVDPNNKPLKLI